jgi:ribosomal-protein-alanine N-acetyltransferase
MPVDFGIDRIATARLTGRRPEQRDRPALVRIFTDPRTPETAWPEHLRTADRVQAMLDESIRHWQRWGFGVWVWSAGNGDPIVARAGLAHVQVDGRPEVELAWFVDPDHWRRGYATEVAREAIRIAFEILELDSVVAFTKDTNIASRGVMEKLGMAYEGELIHAGMPHVLHRISSGS